MQTEKDINNSLDRWFKDLNTAELERVSEIDVSEYQSKSKSWRISWILACYKWWDNLNVDEKQEIFDNYTGK